MEENNKKIIHLIILSCLLFLSIIVYLTYFQIFQAETIVENPYNRRQWQREEITVRGNLYDRNGVLIAESIETDEGIIRKYTHNRLYSHLVGYSHRQYGRSGVEAYYNNEIMGLTNEKSVSRIMERITGEKIRGNHLYLTLIHQLQLKAGALLKGKTGSIVAIDPNTGEILAMVSKPDFNPNNLVKDWSNLVEDERSPLLNRGLSGLYPPGSTYKVIMTAAVLENQEIDHQYQCEGSITIDGYNLSDYDKKGHGPLDLRKSLVVSCNTNFARMAQELGDRKVMEISRRFLLGEAIGGDIPLTKSLFPYENNMKPTDLAAVSIGQGKLLVTPLHMALIAGVFANEGEMLQPKILREIETPEGRIIDGPSIQPQRIVEATIANQVKEMMVAAVQEGTGKNARISGVQVAGKTGTAENISGASHAWFIGFAPADNPQIAVAVLLEKEGNTGGAVAAPIAREIMREALRRGVLN